MMSTMSTSVGHLLSDASVDILAHQGGWDEMAMLGGPALVIVVLGYLARRGIGGDDGADGETEDSSEDEGADTPG